MAIRRRRYRKRRVARVNFDDRVQKKFDNVDRKIKRITAKQELKYRDVFTSSTTENVSPMIFLLNGMQRGTTVANREGNSVYMTSVQLRFRAVWPQTSPIADGAALLRWMVILDRYPNGQALQESDFLDLSVIGDALYSPYNLNAGRRFKILVDRVHVLNPRYPSQWEEISQGGDYDVIVTDLGAEMIYKRYKKRLRFKMVFNDGNTGTITDINKGALWFYATSNITTSGASPQLNLGSRVIFKDN